MQIEKGSVWTKTITGDVVWKPQAQARTYHSMSVCIYWHMTRVKPQARVIIEHTIITKQR